MHDREEELHSLLESNPRNDSLRVQYEECLAVTDPNSVELQLIRLERRIAETLDRQESIDGLVEEYRKFRIKYSNYFWDKRGLLDHLFRHFSLWLVSCDPTRIFALEIALENKLRQKPDITNLPTEIASGMSPDNAYDLKHGILSFIRIYRGPTGREPYFEDSEISVRIKPSAAPTKAG